MERTVLDLARLPKTAWKNGGGVTTDLATEPAGAGWDDCIWRASLSEISQSGPFSHLPGMARLFMPMQPGVTLTIGDAAPRAVGAFELVMFSGDDSTHCDLAEDPTRRGPLKVFNLMARRGEAEASLTCHPGPVRIAAPGAGTLILFVPRGAVRVVGADGRPFPLDTGRALVHRDPGEALASEPYRPWTMLIEARVG